MVNILLFTITKIDPTVLLFRVLSFNENLLLLIKNNQPPYSEISYGQISKDATN